METLVWEPWLVSAITDEQLVDDPCKDGLISHEYKIWMSFLSWQPRGGNPAVADVLHGQTWDVCVSA